MALVRLITSASVFWLALQLCRDATRAKHFMTAIVVIVCGYSAYGIIAVALNTKPILWMGTTWSLGRVNSTFVNPTHFGTYAGIGLVVVCGLISEPLSKRSNDTRRIPCGSGLPPSSKPLRNRGRCSLALPS